MPSVSWRVRGEVGQLSARFSPTHQGKIIAQGVCCYEIDQILLPLSKLHKLPVGPDPPVSS